MCPTLAVVFGVSFSRVPTTKGIDNPEISIVTWIVSAIAFKDSAQKERVGHAKLNEK